MNPLKARQVENFRQKQALMVNVHITHQAGTLLCHVARANHVTTPSSSCNEKDRSTDFPEVQKHFDLIGLEYAAARLPRKPLADANWESENVVSVVIMRHPIDRLLGRGAGKNKTAEQLWAYANDDRFTNNYALRIFCDGDASDVALENAKTLIDRFTYVMDQECLNENLDRFMEEVGWKIKKQMAHNNRTYPIQRKSRTHRSAREKLGNDTLYEFLYERNKNDIALYEWSKSKSLVVCSNQGKNDPNPEQSNPVLKLKMSEKAAVDPGTTIVLVFTMFATLFLCTVMSVLYKHRKPKKDVGSK